MTVDDSLDCGQSDSRPIELLNGLQPLERAEQFSCVLHFKSRAIVADVEDRCRFVGFHSKMNVRDRPAGSVLPRIPDEI